MGALTLSRGFLGLPSWETIGEVVAEAEGSEPSCSGAIPDSRTVTKFLFRATPLPLGFETSPVLRYSLYGFGNCVPLPAGLAPSSVPTPIFPGSLSAT